VRPKNAVASGLLLALFVVPGCVRVDATPDYHRAAGVIGQRTGATEVYDPAIDEEIERRVDTLLEGGLTSDEAVRVALLNNRAFQAMFFEIGASRADVVQSTLLTNPSFAFSAMFPDGGGRSKLTFGFGQQIADLWQIPVKKKVAEAQLEQTLLAAARRAVELAAEVKTRCYQVLALRRAEEILRAHLALIEESVRLTEEQFVIGELSLYDVNLARADVTDARLELTVVERERQVSESELGRLLGLSGSRRTWALNAALPAPAAGERALEDLVAVAEANRFDLRVAMAKIDAADEELTLQTLKVFPDLMIGLEAERQEAKAIPGRKILANTAQSSIAAGQLTAPPIESRGQRNLEKSQIMNWMLGPGVQLTLPIWDQNQAQIAKARFKALQARKEYEELGILVVAQVEQARAVAGNAARLVRLYEAEGIPLARENVEAARHLLQAGERDMLNLIAAQDTLLRWQRDYVDALRDYAVAEAELERAVGGRLDAAAATQPTSQAGGMGGS
jgi:cobalt-zinc-cadmium efflux system outer membrane protein